MGEEKQLQTDLGRGAGNFGSTREPSELGIILGSWTLCFSGGFFLALWGFVLGFFFFRVCGAVAVAGGAFTDSRRVRLQQCGAEQCDSRRLWRKPYLVKLFVAVTQRDRPAINSTGGGTETNKTSSKR